jgi:phosphotransferase family enzyme
VSDARIPYHVGAARGFRYREVPAELESEVETWLDARHVAGADVIKINAVYRRGPWLIKLFRASDSWKDRLRRSPAVRCAELHGRLAPIRTPAPLFALERRNGGRLGPSLLAEEFVEGAPLSEAWTSDERAALALPDFMLAMHRRRVFHGDFHPKNLLWTGSEWVLIDLVALRHPLRCLWPRRLILEQWASLQRRLGADDPTARVRSAFERYAQRSGGAWNLERDWQQILRRSTRG